MPAVRFIQNGDTKKNKFHFKPIVFGIVAMLILSVMLILLAATVFLKSGLSQNLIPVISKNILYVSVFTGGIISGIKSKYCGWMYGGASGILFCLSLIFISTLLGIRTKLNAFSVVAIVICALLSAIGGIFGINIKPKTKRGIKNKY